MAIIKDQSVKKNDTETIFIVTAFLKTLKTFLDTFLFIIGISFYSLKHKVFSLFVEYCSLQMPKKKINILFFIW